MKIPGQRCWLALLTLYATSLSAHPVDEVIQGAYVTIEPGAVHLELDLTPGLEVVATLLQSLDANADRHITDSEARAYALRVLQQSMLVLDGAKVAWQLERITVPPYRNLEVQGGTLRIHARAARTDRAGARTLSYDNRYEPVTSQCIANIFLQDGAGWRYRVIGQQHSNDGRQLTVNYTGTR